MQLIRKLLFILYKTYQIQIKNKILIKTTLVMTVKQTHIYFVKIKSKI